MSQQAAKHHGHAHPPTADSLGGDACCGGGGGGPAEGGGAAGSVGRPTFRYAFKVQGLDCADVATGAARVTNWA